MIRLGIGLELTKLLSPKNIPGVKAYLGIDNANTDKKERVQVGEVNATINQCSDYIYMLIDAFNKQMQDYDLPFKMSFNGSMEELYEEQETTPEQAENESQKEQNNDN